MSEPPTAAAGRDRLAAALRLRESGDLPAACSAARAVFDAALAAGDTALAIDAGSASFDLALRIGDHAGVVADGARLRPLLVDPARARERGDVTRRTILAATELARFDLALTLAQEVCADARRLADDRELALSLAALGVCFERIGDPWQGERLIAEAYGVAERLDEPYVRMALLNNLCASCIGRFHRMRGVDDADAQAAIERAVGHARAAQALLPSLPDPRYGVFVDGNLAEALLHAGHLTEAQPLLRDVHARSRAGGFDAQTWRIVCTIAELELAQQRPLQALAEVESIRDAVGASDQRATLIRLHHAVYRAARALGDTGRALAALERYEQLERERATRQLRAQSELFVTRAEADRVHQEALAAHAHARRFREEARRDPLTGLANRRHLEEQLPARLAAAEAQRRAATLAVVDVDHFKQVNDTHGHALGDRVLAAIAGMLRESVREADLLARYGGEEFVVVLFGAPRAPGIAILERLRQRVASHRWSEYADGLAVTLSIGVAHAPAWDAAALFERADRALYDAKAAGRNRLVVAPGPAA